MGDDDKSDADKRDADKRDADKRDADEYKKRDDPITELLSSSDTAECKKGMVLLEETFRTLVASVLLSIARGGESAACDGLLDSGSESLDRQVFAEVWQETMASVWTNVQRGRFKSNGSLLAYVVTIAERKTIDLYRKQQKVDDSGEPDLLADTPIGQVVELLDEIESFYVSLPEKDEAILRLGVTLALEAGSGRGIREEFVAKLAEIYLDNGWTERSPATIVRRYSRLRDRLCEYLQRRGYHV